MLRLAILATLMAAVASESIFNVTSSKGKSINPGITIGSFLYTSDSSEILRTRNESEAYCRQRGGHLAAISEARVYNVLRASIYVVGTYWVDGVEKSMDVSEANYDYEGTTADPNYCGTISVPISIDAGDANKRCLALRVPGNLEPLLCTARARVLCATQIDDC